MQITPNHQRAKNGVERILGNPALRDCLDDSQAEKLYQWAFDRIEVFVSTFESDESESDEMADGALEIFIDRLISLLHSLNLLVYQFDNKVRDDDSQAACETFLRESAVFQHQSEEAVMLLQTAVTYPADWSADSAFDFLFSFLDFGETN